MYNSNYDSKCIRNSLSSHYAFILPYLREDMNLLDIGCGTCRKDLPIADKVHKIIGIDSNVEMLLQAKKNIQSNFIKNIETLYGNNFSLPFESHCFDVCNASLTSFSVSEVHRVLKKDGLFVVELLTSKDKYELKKLFGYDEFGLRGIYSNQLELERLNYIKKSFEPFFDLIELKKLEWETELTFDGLITLLETTPTIRGFSHDKDKLLLKKISNQESVTFTESRYYIAAKSKFLEDLFNVSRYY